MTHRCPGCNASAKQFDEWCTSCGTSLVRLSICQNCDDYLRRESYFCHHCGHKNNASDQDESPNVTDQERDAHSNQSVVSENPEHLDAGLHQPDLPDQELSESFDLLEEQERNYQLEIWLPPDYGIKYIDDGIGVNESDLFDTADVERIEDGETEKFSLEDSGTPKSANICQR